MNFLKKIAIVSLISIFLSFILYLTYLTYLEYEKFDKTQNQVAYHDILNNVQDILVKIDDEEQKSIRYIASKKDKDYRILSASIDTTNASIYSLQNKIQDIPELQRGLSLITRVELNLQNIRSKVMTLNISKNKTFLSVYYNDAVKIILDMFSNGVIQNPSMLNYLDAMKYYANNIAEKNYIYHILSSKKTKSIKYFKEWDDILNTDLKLFNSNNDYTNKTKELTKHRDNILRTSFHSQHTIDASVWLRTYHLSNSALYMKLEGLKVKLNKDFKRVNDDLKLNLLEYLGLIIIFVLLLLTIYIVYKSGGKDKKILTKALEEIESVIGFNERQQLRYFIEQKDTQAIFQFIAETIRASNSAKDLFLANMSHEIRTPLNGIVGFTQLLIDTKPTEEQSEFINIIEYSADNLLHIVNDILDLSKLKANKIELEYIEFSPVESFEATIDVYAGKIAEKNIELNFFFSPNIPKLLYGDPTKISQVLTNLISNAYKFTPSGGNISIAMEIENYVEKNMILKFSVSDSGIGISEKAQATIFEEFQQADASTSRKYGGTGLGLAISSRFIEMMGGQIRIQSKEKEGTTFYFSLQFEVADTTQLIDISTLNNIRIGYFLPNMNALENSELNQYPALDNIECIGYDLEKLKQTDVTLLPEFIFVKHRCIDNNEDLEFISNLKSKVILISNSALKNSLEVEISNKLEKVIYEPFTFTKVYKAIDCSNIYAKNKIMDTNSSKQKQFIGVKALVAEDNTINQKLIKTILENMGVTVTIVENGEQAVDIVKTTKFNIIFMDIQMPVMNGIDATKQIKSYQTLENDALTPIVALTANALKGDKERYLSEGMDAYASKPLQVEALIDILNQFSQSTITEVPIAPLTSVKHSDIYDVLLYNTLVLESKILTKVLEGLDLSVKMVLTESEFFNNIESNQYKYVFYGLQEVSNVEQLFINMIEERGSKPFALIPPDYSYQSVGSFVSGKINVNELKDKLEI